MGIIDTDNKGNHWGFIHKYRVCKWEPVKAFYKTYKYTGFMKRNLVYLSVCIALGK